ncbi:MAG: DUF4388 domain-containing protein [Deltaproteobacteria bacterium]|nr:DUF4388 domain-containing protein [Deltaproteobacteria bacterium]
MDGSIRFKIDKNGEISTIGEYSAKRLARFAGEWQLAPSTSYLMLFERKSSSNVELSQESSLISKVLFSGVIHEGSLLEFFNFLGENSRSGVLVVVTEKIKKSIFFKDGQIRYATSNMSEDRLGEVLYRYGMVKKDVLEEALADKSKRLGEKLVQLGHITVADLYRAIKLQLEEICYSSFLLQNGHFYFYQLVSEDLIPSTIHLQTRNILLEGVRRMDEMSYFKKKLPSPDVVPEIVSEASVSNLTDHEATTYKLIDGRKNLRDLARQNRMGLFETTRIIFYLMQGGYVKVRTVSSMAVETECDKGNIEKLLLAYNKIFSYIAQKAGNVRKKLIHDLDTFTAKLEGNLKVMFAGVEVADDLTFNSSTLLKNISEMDNTNKVFSNLYKALDEIFYFLLFSSGITIEPEIENELQSIVGKISQGQT